MWSCICYKCLGKKALGSLTLSNRVIELVRGLGEALVRKWQLSCHLKDDELTKPWWKPKLVPGRCERPWGGGKRGKDKKRHKTSAADKWYQDCHPKVWSSGIGLFWTECNCEEADVKKKQKQKQKKTHNSLCFSLICPEAGHQGLPRWC